MDKMMEQEQRGMFEPTREEARANMERYWEQRLTFMVQLLEGTGTDVAEGATHRLSQVLAEEDVGAALARLDPHQDIAILLMLRAYSEGMDYQKDRIPF